MATRVAVIGAGPLGLMSLKNLKEDGFDVTCYEGRAWVGGLWKYSDDESLSVAAGTVFNSSSYRSSISDYPFPPGTDDFPTWQQMNRYLEGYCDHFDLRRHIQLNSPVTGLTRKDNKWMLEISPSDSPSRTEYYDKVVVAIGSFNSPRIPQFDGIEKFAGPQVHTLNFHGSPEYKDKNILLVGLHASAQDVAVTLSKSASKVYVSHRNGVLLLPRYDANGYVFDAAQSLFLFFFQTFLANYSLRFHNWFFDKILNMLSDKAFPKVSKAWNLRPAPSVATTSPLIADEIYALLESGFAEPVAAVRKVTGARTIELTDGRVLSDVDAMVYCTGYDQSVPFVSEEYNPYPVIGKEPQLFRGIFPLHPDPAVRNSLVFLGHGAIAFPGFVQHELIVMAVSQVWQGKSSLPSFEDMKLWHRSYLDWRKFLINKQKNPATFYTVMMPPTDHLKWLDKTAGTDLLDHFGWFSSKAWSFWWRDRAFYKLCLTGFFSPAMWRLFDTGKRKAWPKAREQIFRDNEVIEQQAKRVREERKQAESKKSQ